MKSTKLRQLFLALFACLLFSCQTKYKLSTSRTISLPISMQNGNSFFIVADRNSGENVQREGVALNYTNDKRHKDHRNSSFKGDYYTWTKAMAGKNDDGSNICPDGWRLPTRDELIIIKDSMQFSDGRVYLEGSNGNRCYFPTSGSDCENCLGGEGSDSAMAGQYWSSSIKSSSSSGHVSWYIYLFPFWRECNNWDIIMDMDTALDGYEFSVRCVKTVH